MKFILFISFIFFTGCVKETSAPKQEVKPVLIQVQAEHIDGEVVNSQIILVR